MTDEQTITATRAELARIFTEWRIAMLASGDEWPYPDDPAEYGAEAADNMIEGLRKLRGGDFDEGAK